MLKVIYIEFKYSTEYASIDITVEKCLHITCDKSSSFQRISLMFKYIISLVALQRNNIREFSP